MTVHPTQAHSGRDDSADRESRPTDVVALAQKIAPSRTALLVVDAQNDFCADDGALARTGADVGPAQAAADKLNHVISGAREANVLVIFTRLVGDAATESPAWVDQRIRRAGRPYRRWAAPGSVGAEFYGVTPTPSDPIIDKYRYSAFEGTNLEYVLRSHSIRTIVAAGVATNVCVEMAVREAFMRDYFVVLLSDCSAGTSQKAHGSALDNLGTFFCEVVASDAVLDVWAQAGATRDSEVAPVSAP